MSRITLGSNITSLQAQRRLGDATSEVVRGSERLASGLRINRASDDAAGLAIASVLSSNTRVFTQALRNGSDALSLGGVAEGTLTALQALTIRQQELAAQAANGVFSFVQRKALHIEAAALSDEFNRLVSTAQFNGRAIFDPAANGELRVQLGYGTNGGISVGIGSGLARNAGTGSFNTRVSSDVGAFAGANTSGIQIADINGDGISDIVSSDRVFDRVQIQLGNADGSFGAVQGINTGNGATSLQLIDLNGDGKLDIVTANSSNANTVTTLLGNGNGTFQAARSWTAGTDIDAVAIFDANGDGKLDIIGTGSSSGGVLVTFIGAGDGTFATVKTQVSHNGDLISYGDVNGDGKQDLVVTLANFSSRLYLGVGDGSFSASSTLNTNTSSMQLQDLNEDGKLDYVFSTGSNLIVQLGRGDGTFGSSVTYAAGGTINDIRLGDINGDGVLDAVAALTTGVSVMFGNTDGSFRTASVTASTSSYRVAIGDLNRDGVNDIATAEYTNYLGRYISTSVQDTTSTRLNLLSQASARDALSTLDAQSLRISNELGRIGAFTSRLGSGLRTLSAARENFEQAASRIKDADIASESARYVAANIRQQIASSLLAQANQIPNLAVTLLRG